MVTLPEKITFTLEPVLIAPPFTAAASLPSKSTRSEAFRLVLLEACKFIAPPLEPALLTQTHACCTVTRVHAYGLSWTRMGESSNGAVQIVWATLMDAVNGKPQYGPVRVEMYIPGQAHGVGPARRRHYCATSNRSRVCIETDISCHDYAVAAPESPKLARRAAKTAQQKALSNRN